MRPCRAILLPLAVTVSVSLSWAAQQALELPTGSETLTSLKTVLPAMQQRQSEHYVLLTDAPMEHADDLLSLLETTHDRFHREMQRVGLEPKPLRHRLVAVLFRDRDDYLKFMREVDREQKAWASGYYSTRHDRLMIYDALTDEDVQQALRKVSRRGGQRGRDQQRANIVRQADDRFVGTVTHEAAHQLFFHTGVQDPAAPHVYPLWLSEGLATNFEADDRVEGDFGFGAHNKDRRQAKQEAVRKDALMPLRVLIAADGVVPQGGQPGPEALKTFYAQSHVLVQWIARHRTAELRLYLRALREAPAVVPAERRRNFERVFEAVFGPIDAVERVWLRHEAQAWPEFWETEWGRRLKAFDRKRAAGSGDEQAPAGGSAP